MADVHAATWKSWPTFRMMHHVTSFYRFIPFTPARLEGLRAEIEQFMETAEIKGLVILAEEGINATICGSADAIRNFKMRLSTWLGAEGTTFKDSTSEKLPFRRVGVVIRPEIVTLKRSDLRPRDERSHLSPAEWHEWLTSGREFTLVDTRNAYETKAGKFRGAVDPGLKHFSDWDAYLDQADLPKDKPVLMYCTGGIRCEKAILLMREKGWGEIYQLKDGILAYLEEFPEGEYEGECYVFDERVAVDPHLRPTERWFNCPGCGLTSENPRTCEVCGAACAICEDCQTSWPWVCSKRCRDRLRQLQ